MRTGKSRNLMKRGTILVIMCVGAVAVSLVAGSCTQDGASHDYYNDPPDYWTRISTGYFDDDIFLQT